MDMEKAVLESLENIKSSHASLEQKYTQGLASLKKIEDENAQLRSQVDTLRRSGFATLSEVNPAVGRFVSDVCAKHLAAIVIMGAERLGKLGHIDEGTRASVVSHSRSILGIEQRTALTTSDIPLPTEYAQQVVELVWLYGQARKYATVYPLGAGTTKLPKLTTSPAFGFIAAPSTALAEKSPQFAFVDFTAQKAGGMIVVPSEIDADSIVGFGQFLARYIAREMAKWEDTVFFLADGSGTYLSMVGLGPNAVTAGKKLVLTAGNTAPSNITLTNFRNLRAKVDPAALPSSAYYMNMTMEALLSGYNTSANGQVYIPNGANGPTFDGFPVRWVGVMPIYDTAAHISQIQATFGDASYYYFGERRGMMIETSSEAYFATDQIAIRALERFVVASMADGANAALQLAAS